MQNSSFDDPAFSDADKATDEMRRVWQDASPVDVHLTDDFFQNRLAKAARAHRRLRLLWLTQHIGTVAGFVASALVAFRFDDRLMRAGAAGLALTFAFRWIVLRRTPPSRDDASLFVNTDPSLSAYRAALVRRVADDSGPRLWSRLAIGAPAAALFLYGFARSFPKLAPVIAVEAVAIAFGLTFAFTNAVRRARRYQAELDGLDDPEPLSSR